MFKRNDCEMIKLCVTLYTIQKLSHLIENFWDPWRKEHTVNLSLHKTTGIKQTEDKNQRSSTFS